MKCMILLAVTILFAFTAVAEDVVVQETVTANVNAGDPVYVGNINGDIQIESWDSNQVEVSYTITCENQEEMDAIEVVYDIEDGVSFSVDIDDEWEGSHHSQVDFLLSVPQDMELDYTIENVNGEIRFLGGSGSAELSLVNGDVEAGGFTGDMLVEVVNGDIALEELPGLKTVEIVNGSLLLSVKELLDDLSIESVNADISMILDEDVQVDIETLSGSFDIDDSFNAEIITDIVGSSASFGQDGSRIVISTLNGDIEIKK